MEEKEDNHAGANARKEREESLKGVPFRKIEKKE